MDFRDVNPSYYGKALAQKLRHSSFPSRGDLNIWEKTKPRYPHHMRLGGGWNPYLMHLPGIVEGEWKPTDVEGCFLWVRPDLSLSKSGNDVTQWIDQSDNAVVFEPAPYNAPSYEEIVVGDKSFPTVRFRNSNQEGLRSTAESGSIPINNTDLTLFNVFYCADWIENLNMPILSWSGSDYWELFELFSPLYFPGDSQWKIICQIYGAAISVPGVLNPTSNVQCFYGTRNNSTIMVRMYTAENGFMEEDCLDAGYGYDWLELGVTTPNSTYSNVNLAEIIGYSSILGDESQEMGKIKNYISGRYGIVFA